MKTCIDCGCERKIGRRRCDDCHKKFKRAYANARYAIYGRYFYTITCEACKQSYDKAMRKDARFCPSCWKLRYTLQAETVSTNQYVYVYNPITKKPMHLHRVIAEKILARKLSSREVVHHIDDNPKNNSLTNLIVMSNKMHGRLHSYLSDQRVIIAKAMNDNSENCWKTLIAPMTTAWLETTGAKVIKLWEIGQSAAAFSQTEKKGSETMHGTPETGKAVGDDIVQTTTANAGLRKQ